MAETTDTTKTELIGKDISYIQKDISEIKTSIKELSGFYVSKTVFDGAVKEMKEEIIGIKGTSNVWKLLSPIIASLFSAGVTFLLISYLQNI